MTQNGTRNTGESEELICVSEEAVVVAEKCARDEPLYSLQHGRFVVTKTVEAESFYMRRLVGARYVPLFPCFDGFSRQSFVA